MKLRHEQPLMPALRKMCKVTAMCCSPNNARLAAVTTDRVVHLFNDAGEKKDKFLTKPANKGPKTYLVSSMAFDPTSTMLAIGQTDNMVFVYKLGLEWGAQKSISRKFLQSNPVTCVAWPRHHPNEVVFGTAEGKVKIGQIAEHKTITLYSTQSHVTALAAGPDGHSVVSGHVDGTIYCFSFEGNGMQPSYSKFSTHSCPVYALAWASSSIMAGGNDGKVVFYNETGGQQPFDMRGLEGGGDVREFGCAVSNPSGDAVVVGNFNKFYVFSRDARSGRWEESQTTQVDNLYAVTALAWRPDGAKVYLGNMTGLVDAFDAHVKRTKIRGCEFTFVSPSQVIVRHTQTGRQMALSSGGGHEISRVNVHKDGQGAERYVVAHTTETLVMADLHTQRVSEIPWHTAATGGEEKFIFDNERVAMIYVAGELHLVEFGSNQLLGIHRTEYMSPHLVSIRINERPARMSKAEEEALFGPGGPPAGPRVAGEGGVPANMKIAHLLDPQTIRVHDLALGQDAGHIAHDVRIDWLELNARADLLLFRDTRRQLHLFDLGRQFRQTMLTYCTYVQWVPDSDVVVAQSRQSLCVWYNIHAPDRRTTYDIRGEVEQIERVDGRTVVIVDEGSSEAHYKLDETLIGFSAAVEDHDFGRAVSVLSRREEETPETRAMWRTLAGLALGDGDMHVAERCAAALGDVAKARYLRKVNKIAAKAAANLGGDGHDFWLVRARMAMLRGDLQSAEMIFLDRGQADEAIEMYQTLQRWEDAIRVAEGSRHPEAGKMRDDYYRYLLDSHQEDKAAELKERERDHTAALGLYLQAQMPARAASLINTSPASFGPDAMSRVAAALAAAGLHEKAGELHERMNDTKGALEAYLKGHAYPRAVELARRFDPERVLRLEEACGDWLVGQKQFDAAINHYIEANRAAKAVDAAIQSHQWKRAMQLVEDTHMSREEAARFYLTAARHFAAVGDFRAAERYFVAAGKPKEGVEMYAEAGRWSEANALAKEHMSASEVGMLHISQAEKLAAAARFKEAERLYLLAGEPDLAISMYKKARKFEAMIRLVRKHRPDMVEETLLHLAQQQELEGRMRDAERFYAEAGKWQAAVNMYRHASMWEEAIRVAKLHGGAEAADKVAYSWAVTLGDEEGARLLQRLNLTEKAIEYAVENGNFENAFQLAKTAAPQRTQHVHLKYALHLEDQGRFQEAEREFVAAGKPKEAIEMYVHDKMWDAAMHVAEKHDPTSVSDVLAAQANHVRARGDLRAAEQLFLDANRPEAAIGMYEEQRAWDDAARVAKAHAPHKLQEVARARQSSATGGPMTGVGAGAAGGVGLPGTESHGELLRTARTWEEAGDFGQAVDTYLRVTKQVVQDPEVLAEAWTAAARLAAEHVQHRHVEVAEEVAGRLCSIRRFKEAADLYRDVEEYARAVECYQEAGEWQLAQQLAEQFAPELRASVSAAYKRHLVETKDADVLVEEGSVDQGVELYIERGDWDKALRAAAHQNRAASARVAMRFADHLLRTPSPREEEATRAAAALAEYGVAPDVEKCALMRKLAASMLAYPVTERTGEADVRRAKDLRNLRTAVHAFVGQLRKAPDGRGALADMEKLLLACHYAWLRAECRRRQLTGLVSLLSSSLLRYADLIPADKAFFEAGIDAKEAGATSQAFVMLNRFLDLEDAIEDQDLSAIENVDFQGTDVPTPDRYAVPKQTSVPDAVRDDVRETVLAWAMENDIEQSLPTRTCENCNSAVYQGSQLCPRCKYVSPACVVSGVPIQRVMEVSCTNCAAKAHRTHWKSFVDAAGHCPWCGAGQAAR